MFLWVSIGYAVFELPSLDYDPGDLAPQISKQIMQLHHDKHHQGYIDGLNETVSQPGFQAYAQWDLARLLLYVDTLPRAIQEDVRFFAGGHANHAFFWRTLCPSKLHRKPKGELRTAIEQNFGSYETFTETFSRVAASVRGSGWAWLVLRGNDTLDVVSTHNHDNPLSRGDVPLLVLDVWEHAYYLKYHNKRGDYISNWWQIVNWSFVEQMYQAFAVDKKPIDRWFDAVSKLPYMQNNTSHTKSAKSTRTARNDTGNASRSSNSHRRSNENSA